MSRRPLASLTEPVADQLDLFEIAAPQRCATPPRRRRRPSAPLVDELTYRRATSADDCEVCADEQHAAYEAGAPVPLRRRARFVRVGGGLPSVLLCPAHKADDEKSNH